MARVLVVEDDEDIRGLIVAKVESGKHAVMSASSADEALALVSQRGAPEIAVLDVGLPGMNGLELLQALRLQAGQPDLPAVFLSARVSAEDVQAGRDLGATYLTKPFVASALLAAIKAAVPDPIRGW